MKIAVWHNLPSGGGKRALYHHIQGLANRGHMLDAWCPATADQSYLPLSGLITERIEPFDWNPKQPDSPLRKLWWLYTRPSSQIRAMERHCRECAEQINRGGYDLLFANTCSLFAVAPLAKYIDIPTVLYLQEPMRWLYEALPLLPWVGLPAKRRTGVAGTGAVLVDRLRAKQARIYARYELGNARAVRRILVNSYFSRESVLRAYGLDAGVCYLGIDTDQFRPNGLPRENFVVGLGTIGVNKGVDRAIRAIASIEKKRRPELVWIANTAQPKYLPEMVALASGLEVVFTPRIGLEDCELIATLNRASVMIYTSRLEPFGFAPLEANACETPVVAIAEGGVRETIRDGENGLLISDDDPNALGKAVLYLLEHPDQARAMGIRARAHVQQNWTWPRAVDRLEQQLQIFEF